MNSYKLGGLGGLIAGINHILLVILAISIIITIRSLAIQNLVSTIRSAYMSLILLLLFLITIFGHIFFYLGIIKFGEDYDDSGTIKTAGIIGIIGAITLPLIFGFAIEGIALFMIGISFVNLNEKKKKEKKISKKLEQIFKITGIIGIIAGLTKMSLIGTVIGIPMSILFYFSTAFIFYKLIQT